MIMIMIIIIISITVIIIYLYLLFLLLNLHSKKMFANPNLFKVLFYYFIILLFWTQCESRIFGFSFCHPDAIYERGRFKQTVLLLFEVIDTVVIFFKLLYALICDKCCYQ